MIRDFKAQIFCRENNLSKREIDTADPIWIDRINGFFQRTSLLPLDGDPTEYAAAFEAVYPQAKNRRQYIADAVAKGTPSFGHKVLGSLIAARKVNCVFTTNFDPLVEESALSANVALPLQSQVRPNVAAIDSADRAQRCLDEADWPLVAKLHGDYQSTSIKNTDSELETQDARMRHVLVESGKRFGLVVVGYSGRDASVMEALNAVLESPSPFPNGLYWVTGSPSRLLPAVTDFLSRSQGLGVDVAIVECSTFDELAAEVLRTIDLPEPLFDRVMEGRPAARLTPVLLPTTEARPFPVLRYSALVIEDIPRTARRVMVSSPATTTEVRALLRAANCRATASANGRELAVFGQDAPIIEALAPLGAKLAGVIDLDPVCDSWAKGLIYDTLVRGLARRRPLIPRLKRSGHSVVVAAPREGEDSDRARRNFQTLASLREAYGGPLTGTVPKLGFPFQEGLFLKLEHIEGRWWCGFEPYTFVNVPRPDTSQDAGSRSGNTHPDPLEGRVWYAGDPAGDWRRERWATRYNTQWAGIIDAWAKLLVPARDETMSAFGIEDGSGVDAHFQISPKTGWSRPGHHHPYFYRKT